jgi:hypothetical protein
MKILALLSGSAVGSGIAHAITAAAEKPDGNTAENWVFFCITAAEEAAAAVLSDPPFAQQEVGAEFFNETADEWDRGTAAEHIAAGNQDKAEEYLDRLAQRRKQTVVKGKELQAAAAAASAFAFRACMPKLTSRGMVQAFIACTAAGVQRRFITGNDASALLYTAQLALSAYPKRQKRRR